MNPSDFIAALALLTSGAALALEVRRWVDSGPKLHLSVISDAIEIPYDDGIDKLFLTVTNRGDVPTTITNMVCFFLYPRWKFWRRKPIMTGIVNTTGYPIPYEVGVNQSWTGRLNYNKALQDARSRGEYMLGCSPHTQTSRT